MNPKIERLIKEEVRAGVIEFLRRDIFISASDEPGYVEALFTLESDETEEIQIKASLGDFVNYITDFDDPDRMVKWADWFDDVSEKIRERVIYKTQNPSSNTTDVDYHFDSLVDSYLPNEDDD